MFWLCGLIIYLASKKGYCKFQTSYQNKTSKIDTLLFVKVEVIFHYGETSSLSHMNLIFFI